MPAGSSNHLGLIRWTHSHDPVALTPQKRWLGSVQTSDDGRHGDGGDDVGGGGFVVGNGDHHHLELLSHQNQLSSKLPPYLPSAPSYSHINIV